MRKYHIMPVLLAVMMLLCACRRKNPMPETAPTTMPPVTQAPTTATTLPETMPTLETNIPDPTVNSNSTETEDPTGSDVIGDTTDTTDTTDNADTARTRRSFKRIP